MAKLSYEVPLSAAKTRAKTRVQILKEEEELQEWD